MVLKTFFRKAIGFVIAVASLFGLPQKRPLPIYHSSEFDVSFSQNSASSENVIIYQNQYFAPYYFAHLRRNFGCNLRFGSCGYVAMTMLLSFYDTYWDDAFIPEHFEQNTELSGCFLDYKNCDSPGIKRDPVITFNGDDDVVVTEDLYLQNRSDFINSHHDEYLQYYLIYLGAHMPFPINASLEDFGLTHYEILRILQAYLYETLDPSEYTIVSSITNVRQMAISAIKRGIPCILGVPDHIVIAYDYDENNDVLYGHAGYLRSNSRHVNLDEAYGSYSSVIYLELADHYQHYHSNNYYYEDGDGHTHYLCPCSTMMPLDVASEDMYLDSLPVFSWDCLINEKWFGGESGASLKLSFLDESENLIFVVNGINDSSYRLSMYEWETIISSSPYVFYLHIEIYPMLDPYLDNLYIVKSFLSPDAYGHGIKTQIRPPDWDFQESTTGTISKNNTSIVYDSQGVSVTNEGYVLFSATSQEASYLEMSFSSPVYSFLHSFQFFSNAENYASAVIRARDIFGNWQIIANLLGTYPHIGTYGLDRLQRYSAFDLFGYTALRIEITSNGTLSRLLMDDLVFITSTNVNDMFFNIYNYRKTIC